jgi:uncharacterized membrane protein YdfJ with MMPL/SSD domain
MVQRVFLVGYMVFRGQGGSTIGLGLLVDTLVGRLLMTPSVTGLLDRPSLCHGIHCGHWPAAIWGDRYLLRMNRGQVVHTESLTFIGTWRTEKREI